jgi:O-acetyl-ADP-ribose deacetylase (regulator of RNase III)
MAFQIKTADITTIHCDAIVNSLGVNVTAYGALCQSVIKKANSDKLRHYIDSLKPNVGDVFVTDGFDLPAKHIVHVVPPYFKDDPSCQKLTFLYQRIFQKFLEERFHSVAIPIIGTGANGYPSKNVFMIARGVALSYADNFDISLCILYHGADFKSIEFDYPDEWRNFDGVRQTYRDDVEVESYKMTTVAEYVDGYLAARYHDDEEKKKEGMYRIYDFISDGVRLNGQKDFSRYANTLKPRVPDKYLVFMISVALEMSRDEAITFFNFCGYGLSPIIEVDKFYIFCLTYHLYGDLNFLEDFYQAKFDAPLLKKSKVSVG